MARTLLDAIIDLVPTRNPHTPLPYASRSRLPSIFTARRGQTAELEAMGSVSTLFAIVSRTSKAEAGVKWRLYRSAASGRPEDRVEVTAHAALDLWNQPNPFYTQNAFIEATQQHRQLTGEQWWVYDYKPYSPIPTGIWPVRPDRMEPVPDPEEFITGYMYTSPDGQQIALRREDVVFLRTPHPLDPYRGIGPVQALLTDLDAVRYSAEWNRNFFVNSAEPGGIIEVPSALSDSQFDQLRDRWNEQHRGVANAHRVAILEHGKWVERKYSQRDMQFAELRNISREIIREAFGFPTSMLGTVVDVNRSNADQGERMFARWLVVPDLVALREALNTQLLPLFPTAKGLEFDFDNPTPEDRELEATVLAARVEAAVKLVNEGFEPRGTLAALDLPDIPYGLAPTALPAGQPQAAWRQAYAGLLGDGESGDGGVPEIEAAQRWVVVTHNDDNRCGPCADNDGKTYRNRAAAWRDYPNGTGYIHCTGEKYGNQCRCKVVKRGRKGEGGGE